MSAAALGLTAGVAACGGDDDGGGGKVESASDLNLIYSLYDRQAAFFRGCTAGAEAEAEKQGANLEVEVSGPDPTKQIQQLENAILQEPDGIILTSIDAAAVEPTLEKVTEAGIPVIAICDELGSIEQEAGPQRLSYIGPDYHLTGVKKMEFIVESLKEQGQEEGAQVAAFFGVRGVPFDVGTREGIEEVIEKNPGVEYIEGPYSGEYTAEAGLATTQNVLAGNPDIVGLSCDNSDQCLGAVQAIKEAGIDPDDIVVTSNDGIPPELAAIRAGEIDYSVAWCSYNEGELAIQQMVDLLVDGKAPPEYTLDPARDVTAKGEEIQSENIDSETITPDTPATTDSCPDPGFETVIEEPNTEQLDALGLEAE
jgi:ribose transport system substrate-binding protein